MIKDLVPTILSASSGAVATVIAVNQDIVMYYVSLAITIATTVFNFILYCKKRWKESDKEFHNMEKGEDDGDNQKSVTPKE